MDTKQLNKFQDAITNDLFETLKDADQITQRQICNALDKSVATLAKRLGLNSSPPTKRTQ